MTFKNIIDYCEAKKLNFEIQYPKTTNLYGKRGETINYSNAQTYHEFKIGFEFKPDVWYWFLNFPYEASELNFDEDVYFDHRYNRANGAIQKSWNKGYEASLKIANFFNQLP